MDLLDEPKQGGQLCPKCSKGVLERKTGKYGAFLGCTRYPDCHYTSNMGVNLQKLATDLLKSKKKKTRRGNKKKTAKKLAKMKAIEQAMILHKKQKKERAQQFQNFQRLIDSE